MTQNVSKYIVLGSSGQLGTDICNVLTARGLKFYDLPHEVFDITNPSDVKDIFKQFNIGPHHIIINCTGYCNVVKAEDEERFDAYNVNAIGVAYVASECKKANAKLIHFSTDYVFSGESNFPNMECGATNPLNHYGRSKLMGDQFIQHIMNDGYVIIRTNSLYGHKPTRTKGNFPMNMLNKYKKGETIQVADNIISTPTYTSELAEATIDISTASNVPKIINITNLGESSWYDFALEVFAQFGITDAKVVPVQATDIEVPRRPRYTVLDSRRYTSLNLYQMSHWKDALTAYIKTL